MNKISRLFSSALLLCAALGLTTSCLSDNDNDNTDWERQQKELEETFNKERNAIKGAYAGYVYHLDTENKVDSTEARWEMPTDTAFVLKGVPVSWLTAKVSETSVRNLLLSVAETEVDIRVKIQGYVRVSPLTFYVEPQPVTLHATQTVDGEVQQKEVSITFYRTYADNGALDASAYTYGAFNMQNGAFAVYLLPYCVKEGNSVREYFERNAYLLWDGKRTGVSYGDDGITGK